MRKVDSGGGWPAIFYSFAKARQAGGWWKFYKALRSKNTCKTCALGMGGQQGGMVNERGSFPEVCKKSMQAMASDMQPAITADFWSRHSISDLQGWSPRQLEYAGRLIQPVLWERGARHFKTITWNESFERITRKLKAIQPDQSFWYFSGRSSNEAAFLLQLMVRLYGTNNLNNCSYYCHQASGVGLNATLGTGTATVTLDDLEASDLVMIIGGNPASNHPRLLTSLMHLRKRGGRVIVINPVRELGLKKFRIPSSVKSLLFGTKIATDIIQPHIGGDLALLSGVSKAIVEMGAADASYLQRHCRNADPYVDWLKTLSWQELEAKSGVTEKEMRHVAEVYANSKATIFGWTMGITHHVHGVENVEAIVNLALLRGMVGRSGAGLMPIRGHSNVQGIGSVGVTPKLKDAIFEGLEKNYGVKLPTTPGLDTMACMEEAMHGKLKFGLLLGGNLYGSNPDAQYARQSLGRLETLVTLSTTMNTGHVHALADETIILPVLARDEEPQPTTQESMFNFVRLSDGGPSRLPGPRSEIAVIAELGKRILGDSTPVDWTKMQQGNTIREWISTVVPGYGELREIDKTKKEFVIDGRIFHEPKFNTPDGKAIMVTHQIPSLTGGGENELRMMTVRSEGQFNTVVYEEEDLYRGQERRDLILMNPEDIKRLGLEDDQPVIIRSSVGEIRGYLARPYPWIKAGNTLMYYPEANELVPRTLDPRSKTPAFKAVVVTVTAMHATNDLVNLVAEPHLVAGLKATPATT